MKALQCLSILLCLHSVMSSAIRHRRDFNQELAVLNIIRQTSKFPELQFDDGLAKDLEKIDCSSDKMPRSSNWRVASTDGNYNYKLLTLFGIYYVLQLLRDNQEQAAEEFLNTPGNGFFEVLHPHQTKIACKTVKCEINVPSREMLYDFFSDVFYAQIEDEDNFTVTQICLLGPMGSRYKAAEMNSIFNVAESYENKNYFLRDGKVKHIDADVFGGNKKTSGSAINSHTILSFVMALLVFLF